MANITPFGLRMQPELKTRIEHAARANNRSLNAEIVAALEEKFPEDRFDLDRFMDDWIAPITQNLGLYDKMEKVKNADAYIKKYIPKSSVELVPDEKGILRVKVIVARGGDTLHLRWIEGREVGD